MKDWLLGLGLGGSGFLALCCVTPVLPWLLGALGLSGLTGMLYRDSVLVPLLVFFLLLTGATLWHRKHRK